MRGDHKGMAEFAEKRAEVVRFFRRPDPNYSDFTSWFDAILEEILVTDALSLYLHPSRVPGKGLLGSDIAALDLIDGSLIKPLVDVRGSRPAPPNPSFHQYLFGVPRVDMMTLLTEAEEGNELIAEYRGDQLMYLPLVPRVWSPYGTAPVERAIIPIMSGLRKQQWVLNYFDNRSIPGLFVSPGDPNMTPSQMRELQDALNAVAGDQAWQHQIVVLPGGSKVEPQRPLTLADAFDNMVMIQTCMAFDVMPFELGIMPEVSTTIASGAARQMATAAQDIQERKGTVPLLLFLKMAIFDRIIQEVCGLEEGEWQWEGLEEDEDEKMLTDLLVAQVGSGICSIDEARQELGKEPWGLPITSDPGWATQWGGFVPLTGITGATAQPEGGAPAPGNPPGKPNAQPGTVQGQPPGMAAPDESSHVGAPDVPVSATVPRNRLSGGQRRQQASTVSDRQRRTGATTPAHAGAVATGPSRARPARKAGADRELDLLKAHLRRGGKVAEWQARELPGHALAVISEDLAKGLTADQACDIARTMITKDAKSITLASPLGTGFVPYDLVGQGAPSAQGRLVAAGLAVVAADTGRVLMLQRAITDGDPAGGYWELPGGCLEPEEDPQDAAAREWAEEVGCQVPDGQMAGGWDAPNGAYRGYILVVPSEDGVPIHDGRDEVTNPDDPDGDAVESVAWWDPAQIAGNPAIRPELLASGRQVLTAITLALQQAKGAYPDLVKDAADLTDPNEVEAEHVINQMRKNYPEKALGWMREARWIGPVQVPQDRIDDDDMDKWAASREKARVKHFARQIRENAAGLHPAVSVQEPGESKIKIIDGHHRTLAYRKLGLPVKTYIGFVGSNGGVWDETHSYQFHSGADPANKAARPDDTGAFQDRGEPVRQRYGIDGTAGDAQDRPHPFTRDGDYAWCVACGMPRSHPAHNCQCCNGAGEHPTGHECYRCGAGMRPSAAEWANPFCDEVFRDPSAHAQGCLHCGGGGFAPKAPGGLGGGVMSS
jgi:8-oxo-dGTP pyrophosphatase MutT (NUDIX family)